MVACECREGTGNPEFCDIMRSTCDFQAFSGRYSDPKDFVIDQWCAQNIFQVADHAGKFHVYSSGISHRDVEKMGAAKIENLQQAVDDLYIPIPKQWRSPKDLTLWERLVEYS